MQGIEFKFPDGRAEMFYKLSNIMTHYNISFEYYRRELDKISDGVYRRFELEDNLQALTDASLERCPKHSWLLNKDAVDELLLLTSLKQIHLEHFNLCYTFDVSGEPWFHATTFAKILKIQAVRDHVDEDCVKKFDDIKHDVITRASILQPSTLFINRKGCYNLLQHSRTTNAMEIQQRIAEVVLDLDDSGIGDQPSTSNDDVSIQCLDTQLSQIEFDDKTLTDDGVPSSKQEKRDVDVTMEPSESTENVLRARKVQGDRDIVNIRPSTSRLSVDDNIEYLETKLEKAEDDLKYANLRIKKVEHEKTLAEERAQIAEQEKILAEQRAETAEQEKVFAEQRAQIAVQEKTLTEQRAQNAEQEKRGVEIKLERTEALLRNRESRSVNEFQRNDKLEHWLCVLVKDKTLKKYDENANRHYIPANRNLRSDMGEDELRFYTIRGQQRHIDVRLPELLADESMELVLKRKLPDPVNGLNLLDKELNIIFSGDYSSAAANFTDAFTMLMNSRAQPRFEKKRNSMDVNKDVYYDDFDNNENIGNQTLMTAFFPVE